jgi:hypothetical protein
MQVLAGQTAYAQTNIQLWNQLKEDGYSNNEVGQILRGYELAVSLYSGYFIASGRTQIAHVIGTASILSSLRVPAAVLTAGLIHNVYANGDFGGYRRGPTATKRRQILQAVGQEVEKYVNGFYALSMNNNRFSSVLSNIDDIDPVGRFVILILICERFEHRLNDGGLNVYTKYVEDSPLMVEIALKLEFPLLANQIETESKLPVPDKNAVGALIGRIGDYRSPWIPPASCRRRVSVIVRLAVNRGLRLVSRSKAASRVIRLARHVRSVG